MWGGGGGGMGLLGTKLLHNLRLENYEFELLMILIASAKPKRYN